MGNDTDFHVSMYMRGLEDGLELAKRCPDRVEQMIDNIRDRRMHRVRFVYFNSIANHANEDGPLGTLEECPEGTPGSDPGTVQPP